MLLPAIFIITLILFVYIKILKPHKFFQNKNVPHLKPWPIIGNFGPIVFRRQSFADCLINMNKNFQNHRFVIPNVILDKTLVSLIYFRYYGMYQFLQPTLMVTDTELIKQIGIKDFEYFLDHRGFVSEELDPLFGKNLFSLKGKCSSAKKQHNP